MVGMLACDAVSNLTRQHETTTADSNGSFNSSSKEVDLPDCRLHDEDDASNASNTKVYKKGNTFIAHDTSEASEECVKKRMGQECLPSLPPGALLLLEAASSTASADDDGVHAINTPSGGTFDVSRLVGSGASTEVSLDTDEASGAKGDLGGKHAIGNGEREGSSTSQTGSGQAAGGEGSATVGTLGGGRPEENPMLGAETKEDLDVARETWHDAGTASNIVRIMEHVRNEASRHGY